MRISTLMAAAALGLVAAPLAAQQVLPVPPPVREKAPVAHAPPAQERLPAVPAPPKTQDRADSTIASAPPPQRYAFNRVDGGFLRLDNNTGQVAFCSAHAAGWACEVVPEDRAALDKEIARLQDEVAALKQEVAALRAPPPSAASAAAAGAAAGRQERRFSRNLHRGHRARPRAISNAPGSAWSRWSAASRRTCCPTANHARPIVRHQRSGPRSSSPARACASTRRAPASPRSPRRPPISSRSAAPATARCWSSCATPRPR